MTPDPAEIARRLVASSIPELCDQLEKATYERADAIRLLGEVTAERDRARDVALADAMDAVRDLQVRDADRFTHSAGHGSWCKGGTAPDQCHGAEAYATAGRILAELRALYGSGT